MHRNKSQQHNLFSTSWKHQHSSGGTLRQKRNGRRARALSTKDPLHLVFKVHRSRLRGKSLRTYRVYSLLTQLIKKYAGHFHVKVEQVSIQGDHCHLLIRAPRRCHYQHFFRVVAGQLAQQLSQQGLLVSVTKGVTGTPHIAKTSGTVTDTHRTTAQIALQKKGTGLWKLRPFTRVVKGYRAYQIVRNYIQLNEKEALGEIRYQKSRLRGLSTADWQVLWS